MLRHLPGIHLIGYKFDFTASLSVDPEIETDASTSLRDAEVKAFLILVRKPYVRKGPFQNSRQPKL